MRECQSRDVLRPLCLSTNLRIVLHCAKPKFRRRRKFPFHLNVIISVMAQIIQGIRLNESIWQQRLRGRLWWGSARSMILCGSVLDSECIACGNLCCVPRPLINTYRLLGIAWACVFYQLFMNQTLLTVLTTKKLTVLWLALAYLCVQFELS